MSKFVSILLFLFLAGVENNLAQERDDWRFYTSLDGLRESWISSISIGPTGKIWINHGAVDQMSMYDGYTFHRYPSPEPSVRVIVLRNVEKQGRFVRDLEVLKSRGCAHSNRNHEFRISDNGIEIDGKEAVHANSIKTQTPAIHRCAARLFVCGDAPNSRKAQENLQRLRKTLPHVEFEVEVIDVDKIPQTALDQGIFVYPAFQVIEPAPGMLIYDDLSDLSALEAVFIKGDSHE